ncbi:hypothetical protein IMSAGC012_01850 [Lachnospiraceae bacterium]|nr:hypothetical protein IMSAGC012_01850 [Lachnospiraceae bacterium]
MELFIIRQVIIMSKIVILSFSEGEEEVCQRILQIVSESTRFEGCNELQGEKNISIGEMKLNLAEKNVVIHGAEVMLTNREFEILYLLAQSPGMITLEVQKDCFVGFKGERFRFYLSDGGYRNAKHSEQEGEIKIKSHAAVVAGKLYPDKKPRQQER